ncbi:MAG: right-handed parallel beta-helix repeat-containing protein [Verrucomicrobiota bacterium]
MPRLYLLVVLLVSFLNESTATWYYVSPDGSDFGPGSSSEPFATIQKAASVMSSGDVCQVRAGVYRESVDVNVNSVAFVAEEGARVVLSAFDPVEIWNVHSGSIYVAQLPSDLGDENLVMYNGQMMQLARWPNKTNLNPFDIEAYAVTGGSSTNLAHPDIPDWAWENGGVVFFLGKNRWTSWRRPITGANAGNVFFSTLPDTWDYASFHNPSGGGEFYLQNILEALDTEGEWYIDRAQNRVYFWPPGGGTPSDGETLVRMRTEAFDLSNRTGVSIEGFIIEGGSINLNSASFCRILNSRIYYGNHTIASDSSANVSQATIRLNGGSNDNLIQGNDIQWGAANGVILNGSNNRLDNNYIGNFNYLASYACPVELAGANAIIRNEIFNGGRDLIRRGGSGAEIGYNDLHHSNLINDDCGAIYTCCGSFGYTRIHHNWIHDLNSRDTVFAKYKATGIYLDNSSKQVVVDHNVIWNVEWGCITINWEGEDLLIYNNTLWSNEGPNSSSMARWVNGFSLINVQLYNTLANQNEFHSTDMQNTCSLSLDADPFEDFANQNFVPLAGSCPEDAGINIPGYTTIIVDGEPDIGAYERGSTPWIPGPTWEIDELFDSSTMLVSEFESAPNVLKLMGTGLTPGVRYGLWQSTDLLTWDIVSQYMAPPGGSYDIEEEINGSGKEFYRMTWPFIEPGTGLINFGEFDENNHNDQVSITGVLTRGLPDGLTATIGGDSQGFGVSSNNAFPSPVSAPTLFVFGDGTGSSLQFNTDVEVPSLWVTSPSWALANDPNGEQKITGKKGGVVVWSFTNTDSSTDFFEVTAGAGLAIDELVVYPKWIGVDNITVEYAADI